jgi:hypothetical protein
VPFGVEILNPFPEAGASGERVKRSNYLFRCVQMVPSLPDQMISLRPATGRSVGGHRPADIG